MRFQRQALGQSWVRHARSRLFVPETPDAGGFNPADYGSNYVWFAARLESLTPGQLVSTATDFGTGGQNMAVVSAGQEPTFIAGTDPNSANGNPLFRFVSGKAMRCPPAGTFFAANPFTIALVVRLTAVPPSTSVIFGGGGVSGNSAPSIRQVTTTGSLSPFVGNPTSALAFANGYTFSGWQVVMMTFSTAANGTGLDREEIVVFKSGLSYGAPGSNYLQQTMTFPGTATFTLSNSSGCRFSPSTGTDIAEALIWRNGLTLAQRVAAGKALADIYGIPY